MIEQTSFLGLPLRTSAQRQLVVVLYYTLLLTIAVIGLVRGKGFAAPLIAQTLVLGGLLGGIRVGGPVKAYSEPGVPFSAGAMDETPIELNLSSQDTRRWGKLPWTPLDERETNLRDRAHFRAYRLLLWVLTLAFTPYCLAIAHPPAWLLRESPLLIWLLLIVALSLPQAVLLWTAPDQPAEELGLLASHSQ